MEYVDVPICPRCGSTRALEYYTACWMATYIDINGERQWDEPDVDYLESMTCLECETDVVEIYMNKELAKELVKLDGKSRLIKILELMTEGKIHVNDTFIILINRYHTDDEEFMKRVKPFIITIKLKY